MRKNIARIKNEAKAKEYRRKLSIRKKIVGSDEKPRLAVTKSNKHLRVQVIDDVKSKRPNDIDENDFHAINIFTTRVSYNSKGKEGSFSVKFSDLDSKKIDDLINEFKSLKEANDKANADKN